MRIHMEQLSDSSLPLTFEEPADRFPGLREMVRSGECEFTDAIHVRLRAARTREMVEVEGVVRTAVRRSFSVTGPMLMVMSAPPRITAWCR